MTKLDECFEKLLVHFSKGPYENEVLTAKKEFFGDQNPFDNDGDGFDSRVNLFFTWYLLNRPLQDSGLTPIETVKAGSSLTIEDEERPFVEALTNSRHSLFEVSKEKSDRFILKDLIAGEKIPVSKKDMVIGVSGDVIFDTTICPVGDEYHFLKGFCFHPPEVRKFILKEIKKVKKAERAEIDALMLRLVRMNFKVDKYRHLKLTDVYSNESKVKF